MREIGAALFRCRYGILRSRSEDSCGLDLSLEEPHDFISNGDYEIGKEGGSGHNVWSTYGMVVSSTLSLQIREIQKKEWLFVWMVGSLVRLIQILEVKLISFVSQSWCFRDMAGEKFYLGPRWMLIVPGRTINSGKAGRYILLDAYMITRAIGGLLNMG